MLESAILLAMYYDKKYWHDAERYVKNYLLVHQIVDTDWLDELTCGTTTEKATDTANIKDDPIKRAILGGFAGWGGVTAMSNDTAQSNLNQYCCNAAGARGIYDAWRYAVTNDDGIFSINLLIHRSHSAMDIVVEEGPIGRVQIKIKQNCRLRVRIPEFVKFEEIEITSGGKKINSAASQYYVEIGTVNSGEYIEMSYPQKSRTTEETIYPGKFSYSWQCSTVLAVEPFRGVRPLFTQERFVNHKPIFTNLHMELIDSI